MPLITVVIVTYNPIWAKYKATLNSIVCQRNVDFDVIIADDGSLNNCYSEVVAYFKDYPHVRYKFIANEINQGTVKNVLSAINNISAKYVKLISPGDFLYDENVLNRSLSFINGHNNASAYFGQSIHYTIIDGKPTILADKCNPFDLRPYIRNNKLIIRENYLVLRDYILGASVIYRKQKLEYYLQKISKYVKYAEDYSIVWMIASFENVLLIKNEKGAPLNILWYESNTGISTNGNQKWQTILEHESIAIYTQLYNQGIISKRIFLLQNDIHKDTRTIRIAKLIALAPLSGIKRVLLKITKRLNEQNINKDQLLLIHSK